MLRALMIFRFASFFPVESLSCGRVGLGRLKNGCQMDGGTGWPGKDKVCGEKTRQEGPAPSMVTLQMIPPRETLGKSQNE